MCRRLDILSAITAAALVVAPCVAGAQAISGTVRSERDNSPVAGAVVILMSPAGEKLRGTLTGDDGSYRLVAPSAGSYGLRVDVVGYRSASVPAFSVTDSAAVVRDVRFTFERVALPAVAVSASTSCERVAGESGAAARVWGEARKALEATRLAQEERRFPVTFMRFERVLALPDSSVQSSRTFRQSGVTDNPFVSLSPDSIAASGFLTRRDGRDVYYGPDARVLLSDQFVSAHCFSTRRNGQSDWVGLAFRPSARTARVDIEGVLWLDSATAELRTLEYRYVPLIGLSGRGGGKVDFGRLPSGAWGVTRWSIRMPMLRVVESTRRPDGILGRFVDTLVTGVQEEGGEIFTGLTSVSGPGSLRIRGTVFDSTLGRPMSQAVVTLEGAGRSARSDSSGEFVIDSVPDAGTFRLRFWHPRLDSLGIGMPRVSVRVRRGEETPVALALPGPNTIARERCGKVITAPVRIVAGTVRTSVFPAAAPVDVIVFERIPSAGPGETRLRRFLASAGDDGRFAFCALTPGSSAWISAHVYGRWTTPVALPVSALATAVELRAAASDQPTIEAVSYLPPAQVMELTKLSSASEDPSIEGWVVANADAVPTTIQVIVDGAVASVVSSTGLFAVPRVSEGTHLITFRATGFTSGSLLVSARRGESTLLLAALSTRAAVVAAGLTPTRTAAAASISSRAGFQERRRLGQGVFLDRDGIVRSRAQTLVDLMRGVPGVRVVPSNTGYRYQSSNEHLSVGQIKTGKPDRSDPGSVPAPPSGMESGCDLRFYIDGTPFPIDQGNVDTQIRPSEIAAIEIYPAASSVPRQFAGANSACGVVLIWRT